MSGARLAGVHFVRGLADLVRYVTRTGRWWFVVVLVAFLVFWLVVTATTAAGPVLVYTMF